MDDKCIIKSVFKYIKCGTYIIFPEFDNKGRLHYHGKIDMDHNQYVRFMRYAQFKLAKIGFLDMKPCNTLKDDIQWSIYMMKQWLTTRQILEISRPIYKFPPDDRRASPSETKVIKFYELDNDCL